MSLRPRRLGATPVAVLPLAWLALFFVAPFAIVLKISLSESALAQPPYRPVFDWAAGLAGWVEAAGGFTLESYRTLFADDLYWRAGLASLEIAAVSTVLLVLVGYPVALAMARAAPRMRPLLVGLVVLPFWTSSLIRTYAWMAILRPDGLLNQVLIGVGLIDRPLPILGTQAVVILGIVYAYLPFMVLPIYAALDRMDPSLVEAAADLGDTPFGAFWRVTVPLSRPGVGAGALICFIPIFGEFVIPDLLGGSETLMLGRTLWSEFFANRDWPLAAAVATAMLLVLAVPFAVMREVEARRAEGRR